MTNIVEMAFNIQACNGMSLAKLNRDGLKTNKWAITISAAITTAWLGLV